MSLDSRGEFRLYEKVLIVLLVRRALLYPVTVPVDAAAFPVENGAAVLMMPRR